LDAEQIGAIAGIELKIHESVGNQTAVQNGQRVVRVPCGAIDEEISDILNLQNCRIDRTADWIIQLAVDVENTAKGGRSGRLQIGRAIAWRHPFKGVVTRGKNH
jgi:hypothetical protein